MSEARDPTEPDLGVREDVTARVLAEAASPRRPRRIACLTEETVEILYRLGAGDLVVGVSKYVERPPEARSKPRSVRLRQGRLRGGRGRAARPRPLLQRPAGRHRGRVRAPRDERGRVQPAQRRRDPRRRRRGGGAGRPRGARAATLARRAARPRVAVAAAARALPFRPRVHVEEWDDPLITAIRWVAELVEVAGGSYLFPEASRSAAAVGRIVDPAEVVRRDPEVILASWCGKPVRPAAIAGRPGWSAVCRRAPGPRARDLVDDPPPTGPGRADGRARRGPSARRGGRARPLAAFGSRSGRGRSIGGNPRRRAPRDALRFQFGRPGRSIALRVVGAGIPPTVGPPSPPGLGC